jgi:hypothetical protein
MRLEVYPIVKTMFGATYGGCEDLAVAVLSVAKGP